MTKLDKPISISRLVSPRDGFGDALLALGMKHKDVVVLTADLAGSTRVTNFAEHFPERFFNVGVAEQNMLGIAAGMAVEGLVPFCASYAVFNPGRNWDQLRVSVCYNEANVKIIGAHAGLSVGPDGATHQALEDLAITRVLPNLVVLAPADFNEVAAATKAAYSHTGPVYIRFGRAPEPIITKPTDDFIIGKAKKLATGQDVTVCTTGSMLAPTLKAVQSLRPRGVEVELLHFPTVKPLDEEALINSVRRTKAVVTVEEAQINGGFGGAVAEVLSANYPVRVIRLGMKDAFGESGEPSALRQKFHLTTSDIAAALITAKIKKQ